MTTAVKHDRLNQHIRLPDGRRLGFAEYGERAGRSVFYCHGWPSSRLEPRAFESVISVLGLRLIAPDRPCYGLSEPHPKRTLSDWPNDVSNLADQLQIERFDLLGISGGGPYALACAALIPDRLHSVVLVSSLAPLESPEITRGMVRLHRWLLLFAQKAPWLARKMAVICLRGFWGKGEQVLPKQAEARLPECDQRALSNPDLRAALITSSTEALRGGVEGAATDGLLYARRWDFALREIRAPVYLWHGEQDIILPVAMGRYLAANIPNCRATFCAEDGHFSLPFNKTREILRTVAG
jgi:pimeloyl-ACP methyl ester carboxylesterase